MQQIVNRILEQRSDFGFTSERVNLLLTRAYSAALLFSGVEMSINALNQYELLNPFWFWLTWVLVVGPMIGMFLSAFFFREQPIWFLLLSFGVIFTLATWPFQVGIEYALPTNYTPWIWWSLGMAAMSAGFGLRRPFGWVVVAALPMAWVVLRSSAYGGSADYIRAIEDSVFSGLFSAVFTALVLTLKGDALEVDQAMSKASQQAASLAAKDSAERERIRITALIHDRVLMTMENALEQKTKVQAEQVLKLAHSAIDTLSNWGKEAGPESIDATSCFGAISDSVKFQYPEFEVLVTHESEYLLSPEVAQAITEATLEAVNNAIRHSKGQNFKLRMTAGPAGVKVVVIDDGRGFWQSRVSRSRMGISKVIRAGMESVGGNTKIQSLPDITGTQVVLEWHVH